MIISLFRKLTVLQQQHCGILINLSLIKVPFFQSRIGPKIMVLKKCSVQFMNRETSLRLAREIDNTTHCHSGFPEAKSHGQSFSHEDIGIMTTHESPLQLIQLPRIEIGSRSTTFLTSASICIIGFCNSRVGWYYNECDFFRNYF